MGDGYDMGCLVDHPSVLPMRAERGGYLFHCRSAGIYELHALFEPHAWGRPTSDALKACLQSLSWRRIDVSEVRGNWRSRPPRSFGFRAVGDFAPHLTGLDLKPWILTREAWEASPARRRMG